MTCFDVCIGNFEDPRSWVEGDWNGNTRDRLAPFFPPTRTDCVAKEGEGYRGDEV